jgi:hypothetical protein
MTLELVHRAPPPKPRSSKLWAVGVLALVMMFLPAEPSPSGQTVSVPQPGVTTIEVFDWRWALTQGGVTIVLLVLVWSYRKDLTHWADDRVQSEKTIAEIKSAAFEERISFQQAKVDEAIRYHRALEAMIERANETLARNTAALSEHSTSMARNTDSTNRLAHAVEKLDERLERVEHGSK